VYYFFDVSHINQTEEVLEAELHLYKLRPASPSASASSEQHGRQRARPLTSHVVDVSARVLLIWCVMIGRSHVSGTTIRCHCLYIVLYTTYTIYLIYILKAVGHMECVCAHYCVCLVTFLSDNLAGWLSAAWCVNTCRAWGSRSCLNASLGASAIMVISDDLVC